MADTQTLQTAQPVQQQPDQSQQTQQTPQIQTKLDLVNHLMQTSQAMKASGQDTSILDSTIQRAMAKGKDYLSQPVGMGPQHQQALQQTSQFLQQGQQGNSPQLYTSTKGNNLMQNSQSPTGQFQASMQPQTLPQTQQAPQQNQQSGALDYNDPDYVTKLVQRAVQAGNQITPGPMQTVGNFIGAIGGHAPVYTPGQQLGMDAAKANLEMTPWKAMLMSAQASRANAGAGQAESQTDVNNQRVKALKTGNELFDNAVNGNQTSDGSNPNQPNMQLSGYSANRGASFKNMNEMAQEKEMGAGAKNMTIQDAKVNQAIHLQGLLNQYKDPNTGNYNIPSAQYEELVMGLASLVANGSTTAEADRRALQQMTLAGNISGIASYLSGLPQNANTQAVIKNLADSIQRQGSLAEMERNTYTNNLGKQGQFGNSFNQYSQQSQTNQQPNQAPVAGGMLNGSRIKSVTRIK